MQQFYLQMERKIPDLIQKYRAFMGDFEFPGFASGVGARKGALFIAEKLALKKHFRYRSAIDRDKRALPAGAFRMDRSGKKLFSRAAFSGYQDRGITGGNLQGPPLRLEYGFALADNIGKSRAFPVNGHLIYPSLGPEPIPGSPHR
ncbi:hypothetical protein SDC9_197733 [bioreactor metagenome]|uniref:Uncharacterized protein n=1 Tax=bioreactor metagenome TaxID=1076179 RepID=A0A645IFP5_9ZZZZ